MFEAGEIIAWFGSRVRMSSWFGLAASAVSMLPKNCSPFNITVARIIRIVIVFPFFVSISFVFVIPEVRKRGIEMLNKIVEIVYNYPNSKIIIEGHADSNGGHVFNQRLSQFRANMIKSYLIGKGIDYSRITAIGFGSDKPIADNLTSEGRQKNRRVGIKIKTKSIGS